MHSRRPQGLELTVLRFTLAAVAVLGATWPARGAETEADPFAEPPSAPQSNVAVASQ